MLGRQLNRRRARLGRDADGDDVFNPGGQRPGNHLRPIGIEFFLIEMGVSIDEHDWQETVSN